MSVTALGFNLFKLFILGELLASGSLIMLDAILTGDVFFTVSLLSYFSVFLVITASGSSLGLFLLYFRLLVVLLSPKSSTVIMTSLLSLFLVSSCQVLCWGFLVLLQLLCKVLLLVLAV